MSDETSDEVFETDPERFHDLFNTIQKFNHDVLVFEELDETIGMVEPKSIELENKYLKDIVKFVEIEFYDHDVISVEQVQKNISQSSVNWRKTLLKN